MLHVFEVKNYLQLVRAEEANILTGRMVDNLGQLKTSGQEHVCTMLYLCCS